MNTTDPRLTVSQQALAESAFPSALKIAREYALRHPALGPEFISKAGELSCMVARRYDPSIGVTLEVYTARRMRGACVDVMRDCGSILGTYRIGKTVNRTPPPVASLDRDAKAQCFGMASDDLPVGWEIESEDSVIALTHRLPEAHRNVMRKKLLHAATSTLPPIAAGLGVSRSRVNQLWTDGTDLLADRPPRYGTSA